MKPTRRLMITTIFFGLVSGILFIPISMLLSYFMYWPMAFHLTIWAYLAVYGLLLAKWSKAKSLSIVFPLLLLFVCIFWASSSTAFLLIALVILSWIRSGICFQGSWLRAIGAELCICLGGGALVTYFAPHSPATWAMGVWMFFLVQSLYFLFCGKIDKKEADETALDPFEEIRRRAEKILSGEFHY